VLSAGEISNETSEPSALANGQPQVLTTVALTTIYETPPSPVKEIFSYSKGVQTTEEWTTPAKPRPLPDYSDDDEPTATPSKRLSRRERDREEEIRQKLRREIEDELRATKDFLDSGGVQKPITSTSNFAARTLTTEELNAVTHSDDFVDFLDRSTKVIEKALGEYDILTDYTVQQHDADDEEGAAGGASGTNTGGKGRRKIREVAQFFDERWSRKRMVSSIDYSPKYRELLLASYTKNPSAPHEPDGVVQVWNMHLPDRPELVFHAQSDILTAKFSPFHPNLIVGGAYSGQVLLWDTRSRSPAPVQKTPLTGSGHTHPVYSVEMVGTQNANNIISVSTDGAVCGWSVDMLAQPQESLTLAAPPPAKTEDLSPTCMAFPQADPTFFLVGSEEGTIFPCHRYDRAGAKAGVDARVAYKGHAAPVMSVDFHPARGPVDLGDLVLSSSLDWSVKLWKVRAPAATSGIAGPSGTGGVNGVAVPGAGGAGGGAGDGYVVAPLMEFVREDVVYDARWSPTRPGVFALVDGGGWVEVWDLTVETEEPVARIAPSQKGEGRGLLSRSLNKVAWEAGEGKRLAVGGIDGVVSVFEVGVDLGGKEGVRSEEWTGVKKLVARVEGGGANGVV
jgi:dynein intermediate chain